jgi:hypothetical protein
MGGKAPKDQAMELVRSGHDVLRIDSLTIRMREYMRTFISAVIEREPD